MVTVMSIGPPILRYSYFKIWPWKSMVKVMCVVKGQGHISPSKFNGHGQGQDHWSHLRPGVQLICLLFVTWQLNHFWLRYSKFHIWPQGHDENWPKSSQIIYRSGPTIVTKMKEIQKVVQKLSREQESAAGGGVWTSTKTYQGDLIISESEYDERFSSIAYWSLRCSIITWQITFWWCNQEHIIAHVYLIQSSAAITRFLGSKKSIAL